ncbi:hypothetical protein [Bradyrhizobium sp. CW10]|uniref:hypothetical protein n=1 Tax=Bradyrhizobium sp. CW10 TaxID=2782683 RepID=UPI001FFA2F9A|nr:hypothetical protein [Bradyrhizobium sp. CW10]MCK1468410.1 hypothetical protein [Bradyrhizobium sp. CW10]
MALISRRRMQIASVQLAIAISAWSSAIAQSTSTSHGFVSQGPAEKSNSTDLKDSLGRPCLDIEAAAKASVITPNMFQHIVSVRNSCNRVIKVRVCYFNSDRCNAFDLAASKRIDSILGTMTGVKYFRYSVFQK